MSLLINHAQKWAFIHIPKTGGTSISSVLQEVEGTERITMHDSIRALPDSPNYFIFTFVRNPFTRLQSAFQHGVRKGEYINDFSKFLNLKLDSDLWLLPQYYFITAGVTENKNVSFIGKYENIEKDSITIFNKLNIDKKIPHLNRNPIYDKHPTLKQHDFYKHMYREEWMKDWVRERYKNDFKIFNYELDI